MPKFITIGYGDRDGYDRTAKAVRDAAHEHDEENWRKNGALVGVAGSPVQVRKSGCCACREHTRIFHVVFFASGWLCCYRSCQSGRGHQVGVTNAHVQFAHGGRGGYGHSNQLPEQHRRSRGVVLE